MKKILDVIVLMLVVVLLVFLLQCSTYGGSRRGRTLSDPQSVIPFSRLVKNDKGGYDYYVKGKRVGYTRKNNMGSYDVYIKGRLKYKGAKFNGSPNTRLNGVNPNVPPDRTQHKFKRTSPRRQSAQIEARIQNREAYLQQWKAKRKLEDRSVSIWNHFYHKTK